MSIARAAVILFSLCACSGVAAQVHLEWREVYDHGVGPSFDFARDLAVGPDGSLYITGSVTCGDIGLGAFATIAYAPDGQRRWLRIFQGFTDDNATDIAVDGEGNALVAGYSEDSTGTFNIRLIKYSGDGDTVWNRTRMRPGTMEVPVELQVDGDGNSFIAAQFDGDMLLLKYDAAGGLQWETVFSASDSTFDTVEALRFGPGGTLYVAGRASFGSSVLFAVVARVDGAGQLLWMSGDSLDVAREAEDVLAVDGDGSAWLGGRAGSRFVVVKFASDGRRVGRWEAQPDPRASLNAELSGVFVDGRGRVWFAGQSYFLPERNFYRITGQLAPDLTLNWMRSDSVHDGIGLNRAPVALLTDEETLLVSVGSTVIETAAFDAGGTRLWRVRDANPAGNSHYPVALAIDSSGAVCIGATTRDPSYDYLTLKYGRDGHTTVAPAGRLPSHMILYPNYPNPFNPATTIAFELGHGGRVMLAVYDLSGRRVATLVDGPVSAGYHTLKWSGRTDTGRPVASGVYLCRLATDGVVRVRAMLRVR